MLVSRLHPISLKRRSSRVDQPGASGRVVDKAGASCVEDMGDFYTSAELMGERESESRRLEHGRLL
jgi:hypothetical protein